MTLSILVPVSDQESMAGIRIPYKDSGFRILKMVSLNTCSLLEAEDEKNIFVRY